MSGRAGILGRRGSTRSRRSGRLAWITSFRAPDIRKLARRFVVALVVLLALAAVYFLWLRDSSLVAVERVTVTGTEGDPAVESALAAAGTEMTTLNVDEDALSAAVADMPSVLSLSASPDFPNGLAIDVEIRRPVAYLDAGGTILAGDGVVLDTNAERPEGLPVVEDVEPPAGARADGTALALARVLGAAPEILLAETSGALIEDDHGPVVEIGPGIELRFGDPTQADLKWRAAAAVLADPERDSATYIDLAVPERPVVG